MQANDLSAQTLRRLAEVRASGGQVISLYVNLDPSSFGTTEARATAIHSALNELDDVARSVESNLEHEAKVALREDVARARSFLEGDGFSSKGAHAAAVFCSDAADLFEVVRIPEPVESQAVIAQEPFIEPLVQIEATGRWYVVLVDRRNARFLAGNETGLEELGRLRDRVLGQRSGGLSAHHRERSIEHEVRDHLARVADILLRRLRQGRYERWVVGCAPELWPHLEGNLSPEVAQRFDGRFDVDVENASAQEVLDQARPLMEEGDRRREQAALERLRQGLTGGGRAAAGLDDVLAALVERRVEVLLYERGLSKPGVRCRQCGWMASSGDNCPVDGSPLEPQENMVELAVEAAITQSADVNAVEPGGDLGPIGGIAAVLRF